MTRRALVILGTRPEAIKLAPVVRALRAYPYWDVEILSTGQHSELLTQTLTSLKLEIDRDLHIMQPGQSLEYVTSKVVEQVGVAIEGASPDVVIVQGDTTTAFAASLAAFYRGVIVGHVEAGLRTGHCRNPFPEEMNRRLTAQLATLHFAPTDQAVRNLIREGVDEKNIEMTGNTVVDNLLWTLQNSQGHNEFLTNKRKMLVTLHRRENQNSAMAEIAEAIRRLGQRPDIEIVLPLHRSPAVRHVLIGHLANLPSVRLIEALDYVDFVETLAHCDIVLTDSGGIQEEAPTLLKPVIVARETTERAEAVDAGCAILAGVTQDKIFAECTRLLDDREHYTSMASGFNPFGDGKAAERIESRLRSEFESEDHNFDRAQSVLT